MVFDAVVDNVFVVGAVSLDVLSFGEMVDCSDLVAKLEGFFKVVGVGIVFHLFFEGGDELWSVSAEDEFCLCDALVVGVFGDVVDAGCVAELYVVAEAGSFWEAFAGSYMKRFSKKTDEVVSFLCGDEGAIVFAGVGASAGKHDAGVGFLWDVDVGETFGVFQVDIVFRLVLFDEGVFKDDGFGFGVGGDDFKVFCLGEHGGGFGIKGFGGVVAFYSFFEVFGFADVEYVVVFIFEKVASRGVGKVFRNNHGVFFRFLGVL